MNKLFMFAFASLLALWKPINLIERAHNVYNIILITTTRKETPFDNVAPKNISNRNFEQRSSSRAVK